MFRRSRYLAAITVSLGAAVLAGAVLVYPPMAALVGQTVTWIMDTSPPTISIPEPTQVVRSTITMPILITDETGYEITSVSVDGRPWPTSEELVVNTSILSDGEHLAVVEAIDHSWRRNRSQATVRFASDNTPPRLEIRLDPAEAAQGHTLVVEITANEPVRGVSAELAGRELLLTKENGCYWALVGFSPDAPLGQWNVKAAAMDVAGNESTTSVATRVNPFPFPLERFDIPPAVAAILTPEAIRTEEEFMTVVFKTVTVQRLWQGRFTVPIDGEVTSAFGLQRSYNGGPPTSHHTGLDIAADSGAAVVADNSGSVAFAGPLTVRGNTVVLDHGLGVFSAFLHLSKLEVREGQRVQKGEIIGRVGSTGFSTGPHLHWEMRVGGADVDPTEWVRRIMPSAAIR